MFRDSRGVVHTVSAGDPLDDLPAGAATALQEALLRPTGGDLGGALERCEAVRELAERWQDAFFAALPDDVDLEEEARWAAESGLSLADVEADYGDDYGEGFGDDCLDDAFEPDVYDGGDDELDLDLDLDRQLADLALVDPHRPTDPDDPRAALGEDLVSLLERELLLLPLRVRLEALVATAELAGQWADLLADHEKLLGHVVLAHRADAGVLGDLWSAPDLPHDRLADTHANLHAATGPGHPDPDAQGRASAAST